MLTTKQKSSIKKFFGLSFSNAVFFGMSFLLTAFLAKQIGPDEMGFWNAINSIFVFVFAITLGIPNGMGREIPFYLGKQDELSVKSVATTSLKSMSVLALLGLGFFLVLNTIFQWMNFSRSLALSALFFFQILHTYALIYVRSFRAFFKLSMVYLITAILLIPIFFAIKKWSLDGMIWGRAFGFLVPSVVGLYFFKDYFKGKYNGELIKPMIKIGFPILVSTIFMSLLNTIDRYIIMGCLSLKELGVYTVSIMSITAISFLPKIASTMLYPKMSFILGETNDEKKLFPLVKQMIIVNTLATGVIAIILYFIFPIIIENYLPKYVLGIKSMKIILLACVILPIGMSFGDFFNVTKRQKTSMINMGSGMVVSGCVGFLLAKFTTLGLSGVAFGTLSGYTIFSVLQFVSYIRVKNIATK